MCGFLSTESQMIPDRGLSACGTIRRWGRAVIFYSGGDVGCIQEETEDRSKVGVKVNYSSSAVKYFNWKEATTSKVQSTATGWHVYQKYPSSSVMQRS
jgi:hypothetical protein